MKDFPIHIRFYDELNDFLPYGKRNHTCEIRVSGHQTIKDIIEAEGVPHVELDLVKVNDRPAGLKGKLSPGDRIKVYPPGNPFEKKPPFHLQPAPLKVPRFMLDEHLGKLARDLRMCGIDTALFTGISDRELTEQAVRSGRIILTRDVELLKRSVIKRGYWIRHDDPGKQLVEIIRRFGLKKNIKPFRRCLDCNGIIRKVKTKKVIDEIPPESRKWNDEFFQCRHCGKVYWKGSHYQRMEEKIRRLLQNL